MLYAKGVGFEIIGYSGHSGILHQSPVRLLAIAGSQILPAMDSGDSFLCPLCYRLPSPSGLGLAPDHIRDSHRRLLRRSAGWRKAGPRPEYLSPILRSTTESTFW
jgi:hypothetical protein